MTETTPPTRDNPGLIMPPPAFLGIAVALALILDWIAPVAFLPPGYGLWFWAGWVLAIAAIALAIWGQSEFRRAGTNVNPDKPATMVVTSGPFGLVRNPMYSAMVLLLAGVSLVGNLEWGLLLTPALWLSLHYLIVKREERYLAAKFGETYENYRRHVRRWGLF